MVKVKICGITRLEDALLAIKLGADALGFNFYRQSPRYISPSEAKEIINELPKKVIKVGVFVNEEAEIVKSVKSSCSLDYLQFHGKENPIYCQEFSGQYYKAFRVSELWDIDEIKIYPEECFLLDTYEEDLPGGTGKKFNWDIARHASQYGKVILAGGLTPENVTEAIQYARPFAVDVASGVESEPGVKDPKKLKAFIGAVKKAKF